MKKTGKIFVSMTSLGILLNNVAYATTDAVKKEGGLQTKYIFIGVAALVIVLLLYLGYKMDTKENDTSPKISNKNKKTKEKLTQKAEEIKQNSGDYEEDTDIAYEEDENVDSEDLDEIVEYTDDEEEESLFSTPSTNSEESLYEDNSPVTPAVEKNIPETPSEEPEEPEKPEEDVGEEFDTSLIDSLDDDDESDEENKNDSFDETMVFNSDDFGTIASSFETGTNDSEEENNFEFSEETETDEPTSDDKEINILDDSEDSFIDELKNFKEPESDFEGFSSAKKDNVEEIENENNEPKKYTSSKLKDIIDEPKQEINISTNDDFLTQMEANFQKSKAERDAKKSSKTTTKTTTRKSTKKDE